MTTAFIYLSDEENEIIKEIAEKENISKMEAIKLMIRKYAEQMK